MDNVNEISSRLKRNIKRGVKYDRLMPQVNCEAHELGDGSNNTIEGVEFMANWISKYAFQTEKLTEKLLREEKVSRTDLAKTAQGIYDFLYNHIQYTADGALQQLRSPACAWQQRHQGVDCKSYTIFAMSILQNLGITAAIRQIKQPGFYPEQFTHVYIVIPENQLVKKEVNSDHYVIDATKHYNTEGRFIEKKDKIMSGLQYQGLNAPAEQGNAALISERFNDFCKYLVNNGKMSVNQVNAMRKTVNDYTSSGKDPYINITKSGVIVEGKLFSFRENGLGISGEVLAAGKEAASKIDWGSLLDGIGGFFKQVFSGHIDCIGGSAYGGNDLSKDLKIIKPLINRLFRDVAVAEKSGNTIKLSIAYAKVSGVIATLTKVYDYILNRKDWNSCTTANLRQINKVIFEIWDKALTTDLWFGLAAKYNIEPTGGRYAIKFGDISKKLWPISEDSMSASVAKYHFTVKPGKENVEVDVPGVELNGKAPSVGGVDWGDAFNGGNNDGSVSTGDYQTTNPGQIQGSGNKTSEAGMGWLFPVLLLGGSIAWISKNSRPNKPTRERRAKKKLNNKKTKK